MVLNSILGNIWTNFPQAFSVRLCRAAPEKLTTIRDKSEKPYSNPQCLSLTRNRANPLALAFMPQYRAECYRESILSFMAVFSISVAAIDSRKFLNLYPATIYTLKLNFTESRRKSLRYLTRDVVVCQHYSRP